MNSRRPSPILPLFLLAIGIAGAIFQAQRFEKIMAVRDEIAPDAPPTQLPVVIARAPRRLRPAPVPPLQLRFSGLVSPRIQRQIAPRYGLWKSAHNLSAAKVGVLMNLYAPTARVDSKINGVISLTTLQSWAMSCRQNKTFMRIVEMAPVQWRTDGKRVEILALHRYNPQNPKVSGPNGQRRLVWEKIGGKWMVVEDEFPPAYF